ncbi:MAG: phosphoribosylanthranilate isomerase [Pseudomonadota bacterium]
MPRTRIKICGITREEDAVIAARAGVDAIGLVFHPDSPRHVAVEQAQRIRAALPPFVTTVGLFVNASSSLVREALSRVPLDLLQFHGDESAAFCAGFGHPWIRAVRVRDSRVVVAAESTYDRAFGLLADAYSQDRYGGTGETFNWDWVPDSRSLPLILAGGLTAENVGEAVRRVRPWAVDVSGGVESAPGIKSPQRIHEFVREVTLTHETD